MKPAPKRIVVLTGSGVSAESGVATFRDRDGIWARYDYREVATPEGFAADPEKVHAFYNWRRRNLAAVASNAAHRALAALEDGLEARGGALTLVTQNVDDLHERAGSRHVLHMHGELLKIECAACGAVAACADEISLETVCADCMRKGAMRPYVVWFGETPRFLAETADALQSADLFVSIGASGAVYPAAGFVSEARALGVPTLELNLEPSENASVFTDARYGTATEIVPAWVREALA